MSDSQVTVEHCVAAGLGAIGVCMALGGVAVAPNTRRIGGCEGEAVHGADDVHGLELTNEDETAELAGGLDGVRGGSMSTSAANLGVGGERFVSSSTCTLRASICCLSMAKAAANSSPFAGAAVW